MLKKEFQERDVQRLRNIIQGKTGEKTITGVGYTKKETFYKEGDIWEEDERTWTIKNGIKQNITKLDKAKKYALTPILCPSCNNPMNNRNDKTFYKIHKICFNCVIDLEIKLKQEGKWEEYETNIHNSEIDAKIEEFENWVEDKINESNSSYVSENGDIEKWIGNLDKNKIKETKINVIEYLKSLKK
jgi:hypothetical protein